MLFAGEGEQRDCENLAGSFPVCHKDSEISSPVIHKQFYGTVGYLPPVPALIAGRVRTPWRCCVTSGLPLKDDCHIPSSPAGTSPPSGWNDTTWLVIVILVIGATCILPLLVIAGFGAGVPGTVGPSRIVAVSAHEPDPRTIIVTYDGGPDAGVLAGLTITVTDSTGEMQTKILGSETGTIPLRAGEELTFTGAFADKDNVVATAHFSDGKKMLVLDVYV